LKKIAPEKNDEEEINDFINPFDTKEARDI
jgi:hypothetical protein